MYLLLVDHKLISSSDLKELIDQGSEETDVVNCFSQETLLKVADKLMPDIVIIDFELVKGELAGLFDSLRSKNKDAYIMALINSDYYDALNNAIELGGIDDYMVKPIQKEDLVARLRIATRKKKQLRRDSDESYRYAAGEAVESEEGGGYQDYPVDAASETTDQAQDRDEFGDASEYADDDQDILQYSGITEEDLLDTESDHRADQESTGKDEDIDLFEEEKPGEPELKFEPAEGSEEQAEEEIDFFDDLDLLGEQTEQDKHEEMEMPEPEQEQPYGPDEMDFDSTQGGGDQEVPDHETSRQIQFPEPDLFDDTYGTDQGEESLPDEKQEEGEEDLLELFDDVDNIFDAKAGPEEESPDQDEEESLFEEKAPDDSEPAPDVVRPADEFLGKSKPEDQSEPTLPLAEDKQFFDDLFDDEPGAEKPDEPGEGGAGFATIDQEPDREQEETLFKEEGSSDPFPAAYDDEALDEEDDEDLYPSGPQISQEEIRRKSSLPGKSADEFLFGEDQEDETEEPEDELEVQDSEQYETESTEDDSGFEDDDQEEQEGQSRLRKTKKSRGRFKDFFSIFGNILFVILLLVMAGLSFFLIQSRITGGVPQVGGYQMYIVLSGSMSPEFDTGSLAFVREMEPEQLVVGDIITFRSPNNPESLTTHRIVEIQRDDGLRFITRGDANNVNDPSPVPAENVVGMVTFTVPYVGYLLNFVQTTQGLILLIFVPGVLIIVFELNKILKYLTQGDNGNKRSRDGDYNRLAEDKR